MKAKAQQARILKEKPKIGANLFYLMPRFKVKRLIKQDDSTYMTDIGESQAALSCGNLRLDDLAHEDSRPSEDYFLTENPLFVESYESHSPTINCSEMPFPLHNLITRKMPDNISEASDTSLDEFPAVRHELHPFIFKQPCNSHSFTPKSLMKKDYQVSHRLPLCLIQLWLMLAKHLKHTTKTNRVPLA